VSRFIGKAQYFYKEAYELKVAVQGGLIKIEFEKELNRKDYDKSRGEALHYLKGKLKPFENELNRITPMLEKKIEQVIA